MKTLITSHKDYLQMFPNGGCVIEEPDEFKNEVCIHTFNLHHEWAMSSDYTYMPCSSFCVLFRSNPLGESLYLVSTFREDRHVVTNPQLYSDGSVIININDTENIVLKDITEIYEDKCTHSLFKISKQDFAKCCQAKKMSIRLMKSEDEVGKEFNDISSLILAFRAIWNKAIDGSMYADSVVEIERIFKEIIQESKETLERRNTRASVAKKEKERKEKKNEILTYLPYIILGIIAAVGFFMVFIIGL